jgi:hypothetical protein
MSFAGYRPDGPQSAADQETFVCPRLGPEGAKRPPTGPLGALAPVRVVATRPGVVPGGWA